MEYLPLSLLRFRRGISCPEFWHENGNAKVLANFTAVFTLMILRARILISLCCLSLGLSQCTVEDCISDASSLVTVEFNYINNSGEQAGIQVTWDSVYALGASKGQLSTNRSRYWTMSLNPLSDTTQFVFATYPTTGGIEADTLSLRYRTLERVVGIECGVEVLFDQLEVYHHTFAEVEVVDSTLLVGTDGDTNIILLLE